jgi:ferredoxin
MSLRVTVNERKCQSYRRCTAVAPAVFGIDATSGKAEVLHDGDASPDLIVQAARSCPYRAITVVDESAGEQIFPPVRKPGIQGSEK